jgi:hypothetical protein
MPSLHQLIGLRSGNFKVSDFESLIDKLIIDPPINNSKSPINNLKSLTLKSPVSTHTL